MQLRIKGVMIGIKTAFETDWLQGISLILSKVSIPNAPSLRINKT